jgi:glutathione-regulated potassium-efflux system ancillary protein KefC
MTQAILFLLAALVFVPLAVRAGLGSVLGYLVAGMVIGPVGFGLVNDPTAILHVSELGVVLMLFVIGLELEPQRLWAMRKAVFGGGALQMLLCAALLMPVGLALGWTWQASLVAGLALSLSSTAIAVAILQERNLMPRPVGQTGFAMLLFQDIAAIPLLALAAVLGTAAPAPTEASHGAAHGGVLLQAAAIAGVVVIGRYVAYPAMRFVARIDVRELFTGFALLLVLGVAALMEYVGLSMGLGAFLAGVLLASSEYRHALENDILPFKGLLLGLFFIAVA